jgi:hypothetical protein
MDPKTEMITVEQSAILCHELMMNYWKFKAVPAVFIAGFVGFGIGFIFGRGGV